VNSTARFSRILVRNSPEWSRVPDRPISSSEVLWLMALAFPLAINCAACAGAEAKVVKFGKGWDLRRLRVQGAPSRGSRCIIYHLRCSEFLIKYCAVLCVVTIPSKILIIFCHCLSKRGQAVRVVDLNQTISYW
jgi:hypothetical protein